MFVDAMYTIVHALIACVVSHTGVETRISMPIHTCLRSCTQHVVVPRGGADTSIVVAHASDLVTHHTVMLGHGMENTLEWQFMIAETRLIATLTHMSLSVQVDGVKRM